MTDWQKGILFLMGGMAVLLLCVIPPIIIRDIDFSKIPTPPPAPTSVPTIPPQLATATPLKHNRIMAEIKCERFVKDSLRAPSTARFSNARTYGREGKPANYHAVTDIVEAQNALGVPLRSTYRCDTHYIPGHPLEWVLDNLSIE